VSVGGRKTNAAGILKGLGELGFGAKGMDGSIELAQLVFELAIVRDVGGKPPIAQFVRSFVQVSVAGCTPLKESKEPGAHGFSREGRIFNGVSEEFVSVHGFSLAKASCNSPYLGSIVLISLDELHGQRKPFANGDLEGGDAIVVVNEVRRNTGFVEVKVLIFASLHCHWHPG